MCRNNGGVFQNMAKRNIRRRIFRQLAVYVISLSLLCKAVHFARITRILRLVILIPVSSLKERHSISLSLSLSLSLRSLSLSECS